MINDEIREELFRRQDDKYRSFQSKLIPTTDSKTVIGVRTPDLRKYAKQLVKREDIGCFLKALPHRYFDENQLHAFVISEIRDYERCVGEVRRFLPFVDNWATCDQMSPRVFKKHRRELLSEIRGWIGQADVLCREDEGESGEGESDVICREDVGTSGSDVICREDVGVSESDVICRDGDGASEAADVSGKTYTIRFGIGMLMQHFLDEDFDPAYPEMVARIRSEEYYVNMMIAWYFATALAKQYEEILPYFEQQRLDDWTHNKAIQKAVESYRIRPEQKEYLKTLKIRKR